MSSIKERIAAAQAQLKATIKELEEDGLTPEEKVQIANARKAFRAFKKSLQDKKAKKAAKENSCPAPTAPVAPTAPASTGTSPSELKFPAFLPKISVSPSGSIKYQHTIDTNLHKKISEQKTFPICTGLRLGGEISFESKAALDLSIEGAYKSAPANLPLNEWSSYEVKTSMAGHITSTGAFELVLTDSLLLIAAKFGVAVECKFGNKQIDVTNFFSGGAMTVEALALSCFLRGSVGAGETLNEIYELIKGESCPNFLEWSGQKYTLLRVGVTIKAEDKGIDASDVTVGLHEQGIAALKNDLMSVYDDAKAMLERLQPMVVDAALIAFPMAGFALWSYKLLGKVYTSITADDHGFEKNKAVYEEACRAVVKQIMEREAKDPEQLKALAKLSKDKNKLKAHYEQRMKESKNIQIIKDIYDNLHKNTEEGLRDAVDGRNQILTKVDLQFSDIYDVRESDTEYRIYFKVRVITDGPVVIPHVKATLKCNGTTLHSSCQDEGDRYDGPTDRVYGNYWVDFSKTELNQALNGQPMNSSKWMLTLHADYAGHFKDVNNVFDISADVKAHID